MRVQSPRFAKNTAKPSRSVMYPAIAPKQAIFDIEKIEEVLKTNRLQLDLYRPEDASLSQVRVKVYNPDNPLNLSDVMPILGNLGLKAISELPFEVKPHGAKRSVWIHDFLLEVSGFEDIIAIGDVKENFERGFAKIWCGGMENDGLNRLILSANMNWHEITILRTYVRYLKQIRFPFSRPYTEKALTENPKISRIIIDMFKAFNNPAKHSEKRAKECGENIERELEAVESLDEDRILRAIRRLVEATLRTNYYQRQEDGSAKSYLSMKLDSSKVPDLPQPRPYREIFVYSPKVEAIHLRGDKIARGGLRWSDRHEDFRTEVLGLMKAQNGEKRRYRTDGFKRRFRCEKASQRPRRLHGSRHRMLQNLYPRYARYHRQPQR